MLGELPSGFERKFRVMIQVDETFMLGKPLSKPIYIKVGTGYFPERDIS